MEEEIDMTAKLHYMTKLPIPIGTGLVFNLDHHCKWHVRRPKRGERPNGMSVEDITGRGVNIGMKVTGEYYSHSLTNN